MESSLNGFNNDLRSLNGLDSTIQSLNNATSYSSNADSNISFGNASTLRNITMNTGEFLITSGIGEKGSCKLIVEADNNNQTGYDTSLPEIQLKSDAGSVLAKMKLADNNLKIIHENDYAIELGANSKTQLILDDSDVKCYRAHFSVSAYANGEKPRIFFAPYQNATDFGKYLKLEVDINDVSPIAQKTLIMPNVNDTIVCKSTTDVLTNKTIYNAIFDGDSGSNSRLQIQDSNKSHKINILSPDISSDINLTLNNTTGTIAIQDDIPTNTEIKALFSATNPITYSNGAIGWINSNNYIALTNLSATNPITYNNTTGAIGWTNSNNYIALTNLSATNPITYNNTTGAIGWTNSNNYIGLTSLSASNPITYNNTTGAIGWTNSNSYIALTNLSAQSPLQYNNTSGVFSTDFTTSSTDLLSNKTINNPILTGTSGDSARLRILDNNLDHYAYIKCVNFTDDRVFYFADDGGTILTSNTTSPNVSQVQNYSNGLTNGTAINFGSGGTSTTSTTINNITFGCANTFTFGSGKGANGDCVLNIVADTDDDNSYETSNPELRLTADGGGNVARFFLDNNDLKIIHEDNYDIQIGANNTTQLKLNSSDVEVYKSALSISSTGASNKPELWFVPNDSADNFNKYIKLVGDITNSNTGTHTITLPRRDGETLATTTDITSAINVSTDTISGNPQRNFGNNLSQYVINASNFFVYATGQNIFDSANSNCEMVIKAGDTSSDSYSTRLTFYTKGNTKRAEIFKNTGDEFVIKNIDERLELGGEDAIQMKMDANDVKVYKSDFTISAYTATAYPRIFFLPNANADNYTNRICLNSYQTDTLNNGSFDVYLLPFNSDLCQSRSGTSSTRYLNFWTNSNTSTKLRQDIYGCMSEGAAGSDSGNRAYSFSIRSTGVSSSYFPYIYNQSNGDGKHFGFHTNAVGDNFMVEQGQDIRYYNTDLIGDTNTGHGYSKLCLGDIYCQDIFADDVKSDGVLLTSDRRLKKDIKPIENALSTINKLECKTFLKKINPQDDIFGKEYRLDSGFIAQDLYNDVPELQHIVNGVETDISSNFVNGKLIDDCVGYKIIQTSNNTCVPCDLDPSGNANPNAGEELTESTYEKVLDPDKRLSLNYEEIIPYCCRAIQELDAIVKQQQVIIDKLISSSSFKEFKS